MIASRKPLRELSRANEYSARRGRLIELGLLPAVSRRWPRRAWRWVFRSAPRLARAWLLADATCSQAQVAQAVFRSAATQAKVGFAALRARHHQTRVCVPRHNTTAAARPRAVPPGLQK